MDIDVLLEGARGLALAYLPQLALAIITLVVGLWLIKKLMAWSEPKIIKSGTDKSLAHFLSSVLGTFLKVMLFLSVASMFGIETTSFIAIFGALMVGIGMAFSGNIGHFASGVMLMLFKPFKVGDLVKIGGGGTVGTVESINAFNTALATLDNKRIFIANSNVTGNDITNISGQGMTGVELTFGIAYSADIDKARKAILEVGNSCPHILKDPAQGVVVGNWGDSSVDLNTRPFCNSEHYWDTMFYMKEHVKKAFDREGINIPFPNMEVHMIGNN